MKGFMPGIPLESAVVGRRVLECIQWHEGKMATMPKQRPFYMSCIKIVCLRIMLIGMLSSASVIANAYTANRVWFEFRPDGIYRVVVNYTVPELKEYREAVAEFTTKKEAEQFYWSLIKGGDFYLPDPKSNTYKQNKTKPTPW